VSIEFVEYAKIMDLDDKYRSLGFKCGLEIHQQLLTSRKLFCRCPAGYRNDKPDGEIIRHMRPTLSELGEYDGTALMEFKTKKNVIYQLYRDNCCTYELDDTPPFPINREALEIALKLATLLNCAMVNELHVSRKQYLDGSIPGGFQRTAIVGVDGWIPYKGRKISITHVCLEEDACREISDTGHEITWRTDRLSMPLLEVITGPEMLTPREAMEVDALIGRTLKASGLVRRGIGSVRQDVNVSITGGERAEIKGVPQTWMIEGLTSNEALRQAALLAIKESLKSRGITDKNIKGERFDITDVLNNAQVPQIDKAVQQGGAAAAIRIDGVAGILNAATQPGLTFIDELAGRVRVIACLDKMPNLATSDIPELAGFNQEIWQRLKIACQCKATDALVVTWGSSGDVDTALSEIMMRVIEATRGVPHETRQATNNGASDFERILPGPDRMYPDTDSPPVEISAEYLAKLKAELPEPAYKIEARWAEKGVPESIIHKAVVSPYRGLFNSILHESIPSPEFIWMALQELDIPDNNALKLFDSCVQGLFRNYADGKISRDSLINILRSLNQDQSQSMAELIASSKIHDCNDSSVQHLIDEYLDETSDGIFKKANDRVNYICGRIKEKLCGRIDGGSLKAEIDRKLSLK
jgi:glutamyl-tRNA(Gln) amidotransferase subunit E